MLNFFKKDENGEAVGIPALCAFFYFVCMPLSVVPIFGDISLLKAISIIVGIVLIISLFVGDNRLKLNGVHFALAIYVIYSIGSLFFLRDLNAWENLRGMLETSMLFILITSRIYNKRERGVILNAWIFVGAILIILMLTNSVEMSDGGGRVTFGIAGSNEDPNQISGYFFIPILACMQRLLVKDVKKYKKIAYIILLLTMIYIIFRTGSRGGLIAIIACIVAFVFLAIKGLDGKIKMVIVFAIIGALFFEIFLPMMPANVVDRFSIQSVKEDKGSGRFELWQIVWEGITSSQTSFAFGNGLGSTTTFLIDAGKTNTVAHNHWLQIWCDQGLVGVLLFALLIIVGFFRTFKNNKIIAISIVGMIALSMSLTLYASYKPFWNILMMSAMNYEGGIPIENNGSHTSL